VTIAHTAKIAATMLIRRIGRKIEDELAEDQCGFRIGTRTRVAIRMLAIISE
jgi:hypothetical protein